jgi:protein ImuB
MFWVAIHFPCLPPEALAPIAAWACQFTPRVSLEPPEALLLEVQGSLRLFGGFASLQQRLDAGLSEMALPFSLASAPTARAALWLARGEGQVLEALPVEVTRFDSEFLKDIGVATLGALLKLPRDGLARRCGARGEIDQGSAARAARSSRRRRASTPDSSCRRRSRMPKGCLARAACSCAEGLPRRTRNRAFRLTLLHEDASTAVEVGLASPARDAGRLAQLVRERLAAVALPGAVTAVRLEAGNFAPLPGASAGMFGDPAGEAEDEARLAERLRAGSDAAMYGLAALPDHRPEHAWRRVEPGEWDPRSAPAPGPRPLWLLEPRRLRQGEFSALAGPERIESGWWDGDDAKRDYFVACLPDASLVWVYREAGEWYLHGLFA